MPEDETATSWLTRRKKKTSPLPTVESASIGKILQDARIAGGLTVKDVEAETRIRGSYIEALERDDFGELPPPVYVRAYLRSLCNLYNLDRGALDEILQHHYGKRHEIAISEEIYHKLEKEKQVNVEDEVRIRRLIVMTVVGGASLLVLIIGSLFFMFSSASSSKLGVGAAVRAGMVFAPEKIEQLTVDQELTMEMLPARETVRTVRSTRPARSSRSRR